MAESSKEKIGSKFLLQGLKAESEKPLNFELDALS